MEKRRGRGLKEGGTKAAAEEGEEDLWVVM